ncbi:MAG: helix-turn-helix transcriptional regulator, partial [Patescibacteria group bacterium]
KIVISLKKKREELGFTQEKLSLLSNIPRTTITKVESGSRNATLHTLISMAQAMGKNIEFSLY